MKIAFAVLLICLSTICFSQASIHGTIKDEISHPIAGVNVHLLNTAYTTTTNANGEFIFENLTESNYTIHILKEGYGESYKTISLQKGTNTINIVNTKSGILEAVVISSQKREELLQQSPLSVTALSAQKV